MKLAKIKSDQNVYFFLRQSIHLLQVLAKIFHRKDAKCKMVSDLDHHYPYDHHYHHHHYLYLHDHHHDQDTHLV